MFGEPAQTPSAPAIEQLGSAFTVKVAAVETATPQVLLNWARYCLALSLPLATLTKVAPPSLLTCHWIVGAGLPVAVEVKETELPTHTALLVGLAVTAGPALTVTVALPEPELEQWASVTVVTL